MLQEQNNHLFFEVKIIPHSSKNEIIGWENNCLKIKIKEIAEKGKANKELIDFLSKIFKIAKSSINIVKGHSSRIKKIKVQNLTIEKAKEILQTYTDRG
jgi:uncharacterized protein